MSSEDIQNAKVGDGLVLITGNRYRGDEPVTVSRVGRKYLYVSLHGREMRERFDRATGLEDGQHGIRARLCMREQYEEMKQRRSLFAKLLAAGIDVRHEARPDMSTNKLQALLAAVSDTTEK